MLCTLKHINHINVIQSDPKKTGPVHDLTAIAQNELEVPNLGFVHLNMCSSQF